MNSQYEINLRHARALTAADRAFRLKSAVKDVAAQHGMVATFMGKPFNDQGGSGFHLHVSADREDDNAFADHGDDDGVSDELRHFTAGLLAHARGLMAFLNPTINAYRRIVPDSLAPTHANWGHDNRTTFVRVPSERGRAARIEVRVGDGAAGVPERSPFGGISVTAAAEGAPPRALLDQLRPGAALVCPVRRAGGEELIRFRDGREEAVVPVRFVPLVADEPEPAAQEEPEPAAQEEPEPAPPEEPAP
jgi:hypothetical protein